MEERRLYLSSVESTDRDRVSIEDILEMQISDSAQRATSLLLELPFRGKLIHKLDRARWVHIKLDLPTSFHSFKENQNPVTCCF